MDPLANRYLIQGVAGCPRRRGSGKRHRRLERGEGFPLLNIKTKGAYNVRESEHRIQGILAG